MNEHSSLADRLTNAENNHSLQGSPGDQFDQLLQAEARHERHVARLALYSWSAAFACLLVSAGSVLIIKELGGGIINAARFVLMVAAGTGSVAAFAGAVSTGVWLFRSRTPSLRAIERRLAKLEQLMGDR